jgi:hypothetical protein
MPKYKIEATLKRTYELELEGADQFQAWEKTHDWISDDFDDYQTDAVWDWEVIEEVE